ncbi:MAG: alpha/beta hydrolase fold domain-containing protein [Opitutaceae bacterium]
MKHFISSLTVLVCISLTVLNAQKPDEQEQLDAFATHDGIVYKNVNGKALDMIYFEPKNVKPGEKVPWMLHVHGGGWRGGNKYVVLKSSFNQSLKQLTDSGVACFSIEYRLAKNGVTAYDSVVDSKDAARFLLKNADKYNLDTERYGVWGGSAGGHLSLMTALGNNSDFIGETSLKDFQPDFKCVASYFPLTTLLNPDVLKGSRFEDPEALRHVLDGLFSEKPKLARLLSPTEYLSKDTPPILLLHGEKDPTLDIRNSQFMMEVAKEKGADVELLSVKNATHSFGGKNISPNIEEINEAATDFILSHLKNQ